VIRLEIGVGDRPVRDAGAGNCPEQAALDEVDLAEAPEVCRVVQASAADAAPVPQGGLEFLQFALLQRVVAKGLRVLDGIVRDAAKVQNPQLIVPETAR